MVQEPFTTNTGSNRRDDPLEPLQGIGETRRGEGVRVFILSTGLGGPSRPSEPDKTVDLGTQKKGPDKPGSVRSVRTGYSRTGGVGDVVGNPRPGSRPHSTPWSCGYSSGRRLHTNDTLKVLIERKRLETKGTGSEPSPHRPPHTYVKSGVDCPHLSWSRSRGFFEGPTSPSPVTDCIVGSGPPSRDRTFLLVYPKVLGPFDRPPEELPLLVYP